MVKYLLLSLAELCMFLLIVAGVFLAIIPALCFYIGFGMQDKIESTRYAIRSTLALQWRERNRNAAQRECGKRPN